MYSATLLIKYKLLASIFQIDKLPEKTMASFGLVS